MDRSVLLKRLLWLEPFWILLLSPLILLPERFVPFDWHVYIVTTLFLGWPLRFLVHRRLSIRTPLDWSLGFIFLWLPVNLWASVDKDHSWVVIGYLLLGIVLYITAINWPPTQRRPLLLVWGLVAIGLGLVLAGPLILAYEPTKLFNLTRILSRLQPLSAHLGETIHPNVLSGNLVLVTPLLGTLLLSWDRISHRWLSILVGVLFLGSMAMIALTQSRGAYLAIAVALSIVSLLHWPKLIYVAPVMALGIVVGIYWLGFRQVLEAVVSTGALGGLNGRMELWSRALFALSDFVFTGIGIGTFQQVIPVFYPYFLLSSENAPHAHNLFLQIGVDLGLPGLIAYLALLLNLFWMLIFVIRHRERSTLDWSLAVGTLGAVIALLVHGLLDAVTWGTKLAFLPWLLFALATLLYLKLQEELHPNEQVEKPSW